MANKSADGADATTPASKAFTATEFYDLFSGMFDGAGLVVTDDDLLCEAVAELYDCEPSAVWDGYNPDHDGGEDAADEDEDEDDK